MSTRCCLCLFFFFFFNDTATTEIYTLSLHDALPIFVVIDGRIVGVDNSERYERGTNTKVIDLKGRRVIPRSEEHTSELLSPCNLVCRLLLEKKKLSHIQDHVISNPTPN